MSEILDTSLENNLEKQLQSEVNILNQKREKLSENEKTNFLKWVQDIQNKTMQNRNETHIPKILIDIMTKLWFSISMPRNHWWTVWLWIWAWEQLPTEFNQSSIPEWDEFFELNFKPNIYSTKLWHDSSLKIKSPTLNYGQIGFNLWWELKESVIKSQTNNQEREFYFNQNYGIDSFYSFPNKNWFIWPYLEWSQKYEKNNGLKVNKDNLLAWIWAGIKNIGNEKISGDILLNLDTPNFQDLKLYNWEVDLIIKSKLKWQIHPELKFYAIKDVLDNSYWRISGWAKFTDPKSSYLWKANLYYQKSSDSDIIWLEWKINSWTKIAFSPNIYFDLEQKKFAFNIKMEYHIAK